MLHTILKSKLHNATVTEANLNYSGSCTIDTALLKKCNMKVNEQVHVLNINNGQRFVTYVIPGEENSGVICLNGACARLGQVGDRVIIVCYGLVSDEELEAYKPKVVILDANNKELR